MDGVYTADGNLFIGTYPGGRWFDEDVKPYHDKIREIRKNNPRAGKAKKGKVIGKINRNNRKIKKLKARVSELERVASVKGDGDNEEFQKEEVKDDAGNSFGGRKAKKVKFSEVVTGTRTCKQIKVEQLTQREKYQVYVDPT